MGKRGNCHKSLTTENLTGHQPNLLGPSLGTVTPLFKRVVLRQNVAPGTDYLSLAHSFTYNISHIALMAAEP